MPQLVADRIWLFSAWSTTYSNDQTHIQALQLPYCRHIQALQLPFCRHELYVATNFTWTRNTLRSPGKIGYSPSTTIQKSWQQCMRVFYFIRNNTLLTTKCVQLLRNHRASIACARTVHCVSHQRNLSLPPVQLESWYGPRKLSWGLQ